MALLKDVIMTVACFDTLVSYNNLNSTLITYIKNECACMATRSIPYVSVYKDLLPTQLRYNKAMSQSRVTVEWVLVISQIPLPFLILKNPSKPVIALLERCTFVVHSCNYARSCSCGCTISKFFCFDTPNLVDYFQ